MLGEYVGNRAGSESEPAGAGRAFTGDFWCGVESLRGDRFLIVEMSNGDIPSNKAWVLMIGSGTGVLCKLP